LVSRLSIVVPIYNEEQQLPELARHLEQFADCDIILVDGGSGEKSVALAKALGLKVIGSAKGRAAQMNAGAAECTGDVILFLHADTRLPDNAVLEIFDATDSGAMWGRFDVAITGEHWLLAIVARMINWRSRVSKVATGDQGIFIVRRLFESTGGYAQIPLMEDVELCKRLRRLYPPACLPAKVQTSGRRWESRGLVRTIVLMWYLRLAYWLGVSPKRLAQLYR
jgi:rSAM/selenodomain-associated transferase 2